MNRSDLLLKTMFECLFDDISANNLKYCPNNQVKSTKKSSI